MPPCTKGTMDQNRLVPDQMVRSGPRADSDQDQTVIKKCVANKFSDRTRTKKIWKSRTGLELRKNTVRGSLPVPINSKCELQLIFRLDVASRNKKK